MSHNVWADLGFDDADGMQRKCDLSIEIESVISEAKVTQSAAAMVMGISPVELSAMLRGHFEETPVEVLENYLQKLQGKLLSSK